MRRVIVLFCAFFLNGGWAQTTNVISRCVHSGGQTPLNVIVHGCFDPPCLLLPLQDLIIDIIFVAPRNISRMTTQATASLNLGSIQVNTPLDLGEVARTCDFLTLPSSCPILSTEIVQYRFRMRLEQFFATNTQANLEIRTVDNDFNNAVIWCIRVPVRILESNVNDEGDRRSTLIRN